MAEPGPAADWRAGREHVQRGPHRIRQPSFPDPASHRRALPSSLPQNAYITSHRWMKPDCSAARAPTRGIGRTSVTDGGTRTTFLTHWMAIMADPGQAPCWTIDCRPCANDLVPRIEHGEIAHHVQVGFDVIPKQHCAAIAGRAPAPGRQARSTCRRRGRLFRCTRSGSLQEPGHQLVRIVVVVSAARRSP